MRKKDLKRWYWAIDQMSWHQMERFRRTAPSGHPIFRTDLPLWVYFKDKEQKLREEFGSSSSSSSSTSAMTMTGWADTIDPNDVRHYPDN